LEDALTRARITSLFLLSLATVSLSFVGACSRSEGDSCEIDGDCDDGLVCCKATTAARGTCAASQSACGATTPDSSEDDGGAN
jgi:hypothetical protein